MASKILYIEVKIVKQNPNSNLKKRGTLNTHSLQEY